eukprot:UN08474
MLLSATAATTSRGTQTDSDSDESSFAQSAILASPTKITAATSTTSPPVPSGLDIPIIDMDNILPNTTSTGIDMNITFKNIDLAAADETDPEESDVIVETIAIKQPPVIPQITTQQQDRILKNY